MTLNKRGGCGACNWPLLALGFEVGWRREPVGLVQAGQSWRPECTGLQRENVQIPGTLSHLKELKNLRSYT